MRFILIREWTGFFMDDAVLTFDRAFTSPALRILVGPENKQTTFYCHSAILAARSPYFASIISGNYLETSTNEVGLTSEVDDPQTFKSIVEYMYSGNYNTKSITSQKGTSNRVKRGEVALLHVKVFLMASRLCMDALEKLCLRKLWDEIYPKDSFLSFHDLCTLIDLVYTHTPSRAISSNALLTALSEDMHAFARFISCPPSAITKVSPTTMENIKSSDKLRALLVSYASKEFLFMDLIRDEKNGFVGLLERHVDFVLDLLSVNASSKLMQPRRELFCGK